MLSNSQKILASSTIRPNILSWNVGLCVRLLHMLPSVVDRWSIMHNAFLWWSRFSILPPISCHRAVAVAAVSATCHSVVLFLFLIALTHTHVMMTCKAHL